MKIYVNSTKSDYIVKIYIDKDETYPIYSDRLRSLSECDTILRHYKTNYPNCVISIKNLIQNNWIVWKQDNI